MSRYSYASVTLALVSLAIPLRAAERPHVRTDTQNTVVWTNDDLDKLHALGLISIVGQVNEEKATPASPRGSHVNTQDPEWYAVEAANLGDELERRQARLREYRQALDDARNLAKTTGGINLDGVDIGITPEASIEILQQRVNEVRTQLDALEDLARRNDIEPGTLRGQ
jgi:hypothetical protein